MSKQLIEKVNASPLMDAASFRGSTRLDARTNLEIFEINASVAPLVQVEQATEESG